jgi:hypothetical protein
MPAVKIIRPLALMPFEYPLGLGQPGGCRIFIHCAHFPRSSSKPKIPSAIRHPVPNP